MVCFTIATTLRCHDCVTATIGNQTPEAMARRGSETGSHLGQRPNIRRTRVLMPTSLINAVSPRHRICDVRRTRTRSAALATNGRQRAGLSTSNWYTYRPPRGVRCPTRSVAHPWLRSADAPGSAPTAGAECPLPLCSPPQNPAVARSTPRMRPFASNATRIDSSWIIRPHGPRDHLRATASVGVFGARSLTVYSLREYG
jgi:hypothetical protein